MLYLEQILACGPVYGGNYNLLFDHQGIYLFRFDPCGAIQEALRVESEEQIYLLLPPLVQF